MTEAEQTCPHCGRARWTGDRFCAGCGTGLGAAAPDGQVPAASLYDLDALDGEPSVTAGGGSPLRGSRENLIGLAVIALLVGGFVAVLATGGDDSAAVAEPAIEAVPEPTVEPTVPEATAATVPTAVEPMPATSASVASAEAHDAEVQEAGDPPATPDAREQLLLRGSMLQASLESLDLGGGVVVALDQGKAVAINLETGLATYSAAPAVQEFLGAYATGDGLFTQQLSAGRTIWSQWSWDSGGRRSFTAEFDTVAVFDDPTVGPVVVTAGQPPSGDMFFTATAMLSGAERSVEVADPAELLWPRLTATRSGLRVPDAGFYADDGTAVYAWTWADGWVEQADGQLAFNDQYGAVIFDCDGPTSCPTQIIARNGSAGSTFSVNQIRSRLLVSSMRLISPDRSQIAILESDVRPAMERPRIDLLDVATGRKRRIGTVDFNWWKIHTWSPNGRYLIATGEAGLAAIEIATGETILLDIAADSDFSGVAFLPDLK